VVKTEWWHAGDPGSNNRQGPGGHLYIWMYTPSNVSILAMDYVRYIKVLFNFNLISKFKDKPITFKDIWLD
jgi:hypothetical protein